MELTELYTNAKAKMEKCMTSLERDFSPCVPAVPIPPYWIR